MSTERQKAVQKHVTDMLSIERHVLQAVERQHGTDEVRDRVEANQLIIKIERTAKEHVAGLEELAAQEDTELEATVKKAMTNALGVVAGLYDKIRTHTVARMLRDDYTALSLCAMSYTAMHAFGRAAGEPKVADLALKHLKDYTPLLVEISELLPSVTIHEMQDIHGGDFPVDTSVIDEVRRDTHEAWQPKVTESGAT